MLDTYAACEDSAQVIAAQTQFVAQTNERNTEQSYQDIYDGLPPSESEGEEEEAGDDVVDEDIADKTRGALNVE
jgi:hypothetical protein